MDETNVAGLQRAVRVWAPAVESRDGNVQMYSERLRLSAVHWIWQAALREGRDCLGCGHSIWWHTGGCLKPGCKCGRFL